jgi:hypothetical protein
MTQGARRSGYVFLCALPFIDLVVAGARPLRITPVYQVIGVLLLAAISIAIWVVGARAIGRNVPGPRKVALAGLLLLLPWTLFSLLWVGIGAPFQATLSENYMRFLVLVWNSILVTGAFVVLKDALYDLGERFYSTIGFTTNLSAGTAYLICLNLSLAQVLQALRGDKTPLPDVLSHFYSAIEFVACVMTYVTTAVFATALGRVGLLGRGAARAYAAASAILVLILLTRGIEYPEISGNTAPWYTQPGVIAGIPAIPWIMTCLLGAVLLRRAGDRHAGDVTVLK